MKKFGSSIVFLVVLCMLAVIIFFLYEEGPDGLSLERDEIALEFDEIESQALKKQKSISLEFINNTNQTVEVAEWKTSCGCLKIEPQFAAVAPKEILEVSVTLDFSVGGWKSIWLQPKIVQRNLGSIVHLSYFVNSTAKLFLLSPFVSLNAEGVGLAKVLAVSKKEPTQTLQITTSENLIATHSEWIKLTQRNENKPTDGTLWLGNVYISGQLTPRSWLHFKTGSQFLGRIPVM